MQDNTCLLKIANVQWLLGNVYEEEKLMPEL